MKKIMTYVVPRLQKMHDTGARFTCVNGSIAAGKESSAGFSNCFDGSNADNAMGGCGNGNGDDHDLMIITVRLGWVLLLYLGASGALNILREIRAGAMMGIM